MVVIWGLQMGRVGVRGKGCSGNVDVEPVKRYSGVPSDHRGPQKPCRRSRLYLFLFPECLARLAAMQSRGEGRPTLRLCEVMRGSDGACGFHLSRTQWDPYPWVSGVEGGSAADASGLVAGDCVLEVNGEDVLGQRIGQVADKVRARAGTLSLLLWNPGSDPHATTAISVELTPFKTHCFTDNMKSLEIKPGTTGSVAKNFDHSLSLEKRKRRDVKTRRAGVVDYSSD
uniref:(California timema) hypothetical protein n=1 Tax=Timema californicum TaxID=61474 RepID=A0A7R9J0L3_TIMCA|nr:unnamed protein product [Timema californicum]